MSPEYYNSRNQEAYQVELISHKNSSKGRSEKQRIRLGGKKRWGRGGGSGLLPYLPSEPCSSQMPASPLLEGVECPIQMFLLTQPVQLQTLQMTSQQSISKGQGKKTFTVLSVQHAAWYQHHLHLICNAVSKGTQPGRQESQPSTEELQCFEPCERPLSSPVT